MDNYEYIISSLPVLSPEVKPGEPSRRSAFGSCFAKA